MRRMSETITAIRRLDARPVLERPEFLARATTELSTVAGIYPLDADRDFLTSGYTLLKVSSVTEHVSRDRPYSPFFYERYYLTKKNFILPYAKRVYKQGVFAENYIYVNSYNLFLGERGRGRADSVCTTHRLARRQYNRHLAPCFLSDRSVDTEFPLDHDPTDVDELDVMSLEGWVPIRELRPFGTRHYLGMFDAACPWQNEIIRSVLDCDTPLLSRLSREAGVEIGQYLADALLNLPIYEFKIQASPVVDMGDPGEYQLRSVEFTCPITARLWEWKDKDTRRWDEFPDYLSRDVRSHIAMIYGELGHYLYEAGFDLGIIRNVTIYRGSDDVVAVVVDPVGPVDYNPPLTVLTVDLARSLLVNPSLVPRR